MRKNLTNILKGISGPENMSVVDLMLSTINVIKPSENLFFK